MRKEQWRQQISCFEKHIPFSSSIRDNNRIKEWKRRRESGLTGLKKSRRMSRQDFEDTGTHVSETENSEM